MTQIFLYLEVLCLFLAANVQFYLKYFHEKIDKFRSTFFYRTREEKFS